MLNSKRGNCPALSISPNVECRAGHCRTVLHQTKPEPFRLRRRVRKSDSVIDDRQTEFGAILGKPNIDLLRSTMFDRVCHGFLGDSIKLICNRAIVDPNGLIAIKNAPDPETLGCIFSELLQCHQ